MGKDGGWQQMTESTVLLPTAFLQLTDWRDQKEPVCPLDILPSDIDIEEVPSQQSLLKAEQTLLSQPFLVS